MCAFSLIFVTIYCPTCTSFSNADRVKASIEKLDKAHTANRKPQARMDSFFAVKSNPAADAKRKKKLQDDKAKKKQKVIDDRKKKVKGKK